MYEEKPTAPAPQEQDVPLPATLTFLLIMGVTFAILWFGIFALLKGRW